MPELPGELIGDQLLGRRKLDPPTSGIALQNPLASPDRDKGAATGARTRLIPRACLLGQLHIRARRGAMSQYVARLTQL